MNRQILHFQIQIENQKDGSLFFFHKDVQMSGPKSNGNFRILL